MKTKSTVSFFNLHRLFVVDGLTVTIMPHHSLVGRFEPTVLTNCLSRMTDRWPYQRVIIEPFELMLLFCFLLDT